ncbi:MAG: hypothetical protein D6765_01710 [Bacteroidetes bacterium]|nr:MAG: hypothetical protein D6765_01710 [Bacteroidota bacterium]
MRWLTPFINLLLYSNFWIGACAAAMALQSHWLLGGRYEWTALSGFIFCATLFLYALHRLAGLKKLLPFTSEGRFQVIFRFRSHIVLYAVAAAGGALWFFLQLPRSLQWGLLVPAGLSLGYVLPVLGKKRRLRDVHYLKIFLIAAVWSWVTVLLPALELRAMHEAGTYVMALERALFIFAITLPFDIRDLQIDAFQRVKTLPGQLGIPAAKRLAAGALAAMTACVLANFFLGTYEWKDLLALSLSALLTLALILPSDRISHDYYFTGVLDGTMLLQFVLVALAQTL